MTDLTIGQRIAEERKKLGLSQEALGEKMGVSRQAISKWESDAAMPEVDKLIALIRLFGVSVGWLLGVEEAAPVRDDGLSETQLKMVEEIVKKYPSPPQPFPHFTKWQHIAVICMTACIFISLFAIQITNVRQENAIANKMDTSAYSSLAARVAALEASSPAGSGNTGAVSGNLLANYRFEQELLFSAANNSGSSAIVLLHATPYIWQDGDRGYLSVRLDGKEIQRQECSWDGSQLNANITVGLQNGYQYCFLLLHADGTQEQQMLSDIYAQNLLDTFSVTAEVTPGKFYFKNGVLTLSGYEIRCTKPFALATYGNLSWSRLDFVLYRVSALDPENRTELGRDTVLDALTEADAGLLTGSEIQIGNHLIQFRDVELSEDTYLELRFCAEVTNGLSTEIPVHTLRSDGNGGLRIP